MARPDVFRDRFSCGQSLALVPVLEQGVSRLTLVGLCQNTMFWRCCPQGIHCAVLDGTCLLVDKCWFEST